MPINRVPTFSPVLFDLDGTLIDSAPGIIAGIRDTLAELGWPEEDHATLMRHVGPPLETGFQEVSGMTPEQADDAKIVYRRFYGTERGFLNAAVYPGAIEMLTALQDAAVPMAIATSKEEGLAKEVAETFGLTPFFHTITGSTFDTTRRTKALVVREALARLRATEITIERPVLIGDRAHDIIGATTEGIDSIAATWGYGTPAELANATMQAMTPAEVVQAVLSPAR